MIHRSLREWEYLPVSEEGVRRLDPPDGRRTVSSGPLAKPGSEARTARVCSSMVIGGWVLGRWLDILAAPGRPWKSCRRSTRSMRERCEPARPHAREVFDLDVTSASLTGVSSQFDSTMRGGDVAFRRPQRAAKTNAAHRAVVRFLRPLPPSRRSRSCLGIRVVLDRTNSDWKDAAVTPRGLLAQ